jgi:hypothetical protein
MSGGIYYNAFRKVEDMAEAVTVNPEAENFPDRQAMANLLRNVAVAMRELEFYDTNDTNDWEVVKKAFRSVGYEEPRIVAGTLQHELKDPIELNDLTLEKIFPKDIWAFAEGARAEYKAPLFLDGAGRLWFKQVDGFPVHRWKCVEASNNTRAWAYCYLKPVPPP